MTDNQRKATVDHSIHLYHAHKGPGIFPPLNLPTARSFGRPGRRRFRSLRVCRQLGTEPWSLDVELICWGDAEATGSGWVGDRDRDGEVTGEEHAGWTMWME